MVEIYNQARAPVACFVAKDVTEGELRALIVGEEVQLVVNKTDGLLGFVSVWKQERFIHHLYIRPEYQSVGLGQRLIAACVARYGLPLSLKSLIANKKACNFYERHDWIGLVDGTGLDGPYRHYWLRDI